MTLKQAMHQGQSVGHHRKGLDLSHVLTYSDYQYARRTAGKAADDLWVLLPTLQGGI